jgi:hypothetical protein
MEIVLFVATLIVLGVAIGSVALAAVRGTANPAALRSAIVPEPISRFFVRRTELDDSPADPVETLLLKIERHVQLEQAACESFLLAPTVESLHVKTMSPLGR